MVGFWSWLLGVIWLDRAEKSNTCPACNLPFITKYDLGKHVLDSAVQEKMALQEKGIFATIFSAEGRHVKLIESKNPKFLEDEEVARGFHQANKEIQNTRDDLWKIPKSPQKKKRKI